MKNRSELLRIIYDEQLKTQRTIMNESSTNSHIQISTDESVCKMLVTYLRGKDIKLLEPDKLVEYLKKKDLISKDTISLYGGLRLCTIRDFLVLEYAEPIKDKNGQSYDQIIQLFLNGEGCKIETYCDIDKNKINPDMLIKVMPFDEKKLAVITDYLNKVYQHMLINKKDNHIKR